jgi:NAD(P)-dependent dehydrogenase (short-subunit alcohol dehydrogenase family)
VSAGRTVLVTGAARGLGLAACAELEKEGYEIIRWDRDSAGDSRVVEVDVADEASVRGAAKDLPALAGVVTSAGVGSREGLVEISYPEWKRTQDVNVNGTFLTATATLSALEAGRGALVTVGSVNGKLGFTARGAYCTSKAAVIMLTRCLAIDWAPRGVRAVCVCPGFVNAGMAKQGIDKGALDVGAITGHTPLGRLVEDTEVASAISFVLSERASAITGSEILVDGGFVALGGI